MGHINQHGRRSGWWLLALVALLAGVACSEQSQVDPDAPITVAGTVVAPGGTPAADRPVKLGTGISDGEGAFAVLTLGLSCTSGACTGDVQDMTTDASGGYVFTLVGRDTRSSFGEAVAVLVSATGALQPGDVSGPMSSARFRVQSTALELPALELVDPGLSVEDTSGIVARWATGKPGPYELTYDDGEDVPVWMVRTTESAATIDPRILEDTAGRVVVAGSFEDAIEGSSVEMRWRSSGVPYAAGAGAPPSRGRTCRYIDAGGNAAAASGGCALTDGDLTAEDAPPPACPTPSETTTCSESVAAIVDVGDPVPAQLLVVRGCEGGCAVAVSADGVVFRSAGSVSEGFGTIALNGEPIRSVKVGVGTGFGLREVSLWGPPPERGLISLDEGRTRDLARPYGAGGNGRHGLPLLLVALAIVAAAGVLVGVGLTLGRRRSPIPA